MQLEPLLDLPARDAAVEQHRRAAATQSRVSEREWDAVVLQQQSELPAFATSDAVVRNAPLGEDNYFAVPKVVE